MKQIAAVAEEKEYADYMKDNLDRYFTDFVEISSYSMKEAAECGLLREDIVCVTFSAFEPIKRYISETTPLLTFNRALTKENIEPLKALPKGSRALLANLHYQGCMQIISELYSLGFRDIELVPYCGGEYDRSITTAVTPNTYQVVPEGIRQVINIGYREIDLSSILGIARVLGLDKGFYASSGFAEAKKRFAYLGGVEELLGENENLDARIENLIQMMEEGVLITDIEGNVCILNLKARKFLETTLSGTLADGNLYELIPDLEWLGACSERSLVKAGGKNLILRASPILREERCSGFIVTLDDFEEAEKKQNKLRIKLSRNDHKAKYHFSDIIGSSPVLRETIHVAQRMALSDFSVLITGESGTGKEVFAQSIHNGSLRRNEAFVAVNCAAIPENLLESEMFGYEEGAFTGARKGGKTGYFEISHKGTIFLDEIAELPLMLQSKLLRVIEEREIIKVGGSGAVKIDVRIIAATNKALDKMVREGTFREDLYYRLNVLPLQLPALRERREDILILANHFLERIGASLSFSKEVENALISYQWKGNIRELRNAVEYFVCLGNEHIELSELPPYLKQSGLKQGVEQSGLKQGVEQGGLKQGVEQSGWKQGVEQGGLKQGDLMQGRENETPQLPQITQGSIEEFLLEELYWARSNGKRVGRRSLEQIAGDRSLWFSEMEIRNTIIQMERIGLVKSARGRGGTSITAEGIAFLNEIKRD